MTFNTTKTAATRNIAIFGDWHGDADFALRQLKKVHENGPVDAYLHVGDFGVWPGSDFLDKVNETLTEQGKELWFIDGNHEDFNMIRQAESDYRGLGTIRSHIYHIPRGFSWVLGGKVFMGLGGATSIDRNLRQAGVSWFRDEEISNKNLNDALVRGHVDVLITHDSPKLPVPSRNFSIPEDIQFDADENRRKIGQVIVSSGATLNVHGHHHLAYESNFFCCRVVGLGDNNGTLDRNVLQLDLAAL